MHLHSELFVYIYSTVTSSFQEQNVTLLQAKNDLFVQLQTEQDTLAECEDKIVALVNQKAEYENQVKEYEERLNEEENSNEKLEGDKRKVRGWGKYDIWRVADVKEGN